jgi:hypothetical protein
MPDSYYSGLTPVLPIVTYTSGSTYAINAGSALAAGASSASADITFTGVAVTDHNVALSPRDGYVIPKGIALVSARVTAANTISVVWKNTTNASITCPAAATWTAVVYTPFFIVADSTE